MLGKCHAQLAIPIPLNSSLLSTVYEENWGKKRTVLSIYLLRKIRSKVSEFCVCRGFAVVILRVPKYHTLLHSTRAGD